MHEHLSIQFPPFHLDLANERLFKNREALSLRPKSLAVLRYLAERAGRLVKKEELLDAVWPDTAVTDTLLKGCVKEIRHALGDDASAPRFIETAHRRGYRFIAEVDRATDPDVMQLADFASGERRASRPHTHEPIHPSVARPDDCFVGRSQGLSQLDEMFQLASTGRRQTVFVTGEPGFGKTTIIERFLRSISYDPNVAIARGHCMEQYGCGEPYLPILDALSDLCREPDCSNLTRVLSRYAPTWLRRIGSAIDLASFNASSPKVPTGGPERMLREMADAFEALSSDTTLVLVIEDLQWADYSTLDLITAIARRRKPAKLMLFGSYRPVDAILGGHPVREVKQELRMHNLCRELRIGMLNEEEVRDYLLVRFPVNYFPKTLAHSLYKRTEGHPLFMVNAVDHLVSRGFIAEENQVWLQKTAVVEDQIEVPEDIRRMIEKQAERLSTFDRRLLEAASVIGKEFSTSDLSYALREDPVQVEEACETFARRNQFLESMGAADLPDGAVSARYRFAHAIYQNVFYRALPAAQRIRLHLVVAERWETIHRESIEDFAVELAMHFEEGRAYHRAITYLRMAADNELRRSANNEATSYLMKAHELTKRVPQSETEGRG